MPTQKKPLSVKRKQSGVRLDPHLVKNLKHLAIDREVPINDLLEEAIKDLLNKYKTAK